MNNVVEKFKKGNKIHIKESQKGSFTKWCGGNVTNECIQRGKNSSNPKIRKKATFAANARNWKHKKGGAFRTGVNVLDSNPKMSKAASRKVKKHQYGGDINNSNAMGGTAFTSWLNYQLRLPELLKQQEEERKRKLELEQQKTAQKTDTIQSIIGSVGNFAMNKLGSLLNKSTSKVDNGSPSSTTNFWNTPTIKNSQVTGDFWNNPTIANSLA